MLFRSQNLERLFDLQNALKRMNSVDTQGDVLDFVEDLRTPTSK